MQHGMVIHQQVIALCPLMGVEAIAVIQVSYQLTQKSVTLRRGHALHLGLHWINGHIILIKGFNKAHSLTFSRWMRANQWLLNSPTIMRLFLSKIADHLILILLQLLGPTLPPALLPYCSHPILYQHRTLGLIISSLPEHLLLI